MVHSCLASSSSIMLSLLQRMTVRFSFVFVFSFRSESKCDLLGRALNWLILGFKEVSYRLSAGHWFPLFSSGCWALSSQRCWRNPPVLRIPSSNALYGYRASTVSFCWGCDRGTRLRRSGGFRVLVKRDALIGGGLCGLIASSSLRREKWWACGLPWFLWDSRGCSYRITWCWLSRTNWFFPFSDFNYTDRYHTGPFKLIK